MTYIPDDATPEETAELADEQRAIALQQRAIARQQRGTAESDHAFGHVLRFPGFPPVRGAGPAITAVES